ncbi:MAG: DPP IV N-terminal domain-containing protein [Bacillota bacterium]|nr:DPP IV N-terminal domain-containing protein [Bacillota bacterium]
MKLPLKRRLALAAVCLVLLVATACPALAAEKLRIAVIDFKVSKALPTIDGQVVAEHITTLLQKAGRFQVFQRTQLQAILDEAGLSMTGLVDQTTKIEAGKIKGVDVLVMGSIGKIGTTLVINVWFANTTTGQISAAEQVEGSGEADLLNMIHTIVQKIEYMFPLTGYVVHVSGNQVMVDLGTGDGLRPGTELKIYREGEVIRHPKTGEVLTVTEIAVGTMRVHQVQDAVSTGELVSVEQGATVQVGDKVRISSGQAELAPPATPATPAAVPGSPVAPGPAAPATPVAPATPAAPQSPAPVGEPQGRIVYVSNRNGMPTIHVVGLDGTQAGESTADGYDILGLEMSRDSSYMLLSSSREGSWDLFLSETASNGGLKRLTSKPGSEIEATLSPDGKRVAYASDEDGDWDIFVMNVDGSGEKKLTNNTASDGQPAWSPDGRKIAFASDRDGNWEIYVMNADGSFPTRLTSTPDAIEGSPTWSADGRRIAFHSTRDKDGLGQIYAMNSNGTGPKRLTDLASNCYYPSWSPDGKYIAFTSDSDGSWKSFDIYIMGADGGRATRLSNFGAGTVRATWSPDSSALVFPSTAKQNIDIYCLDITAGKEFRITDNKADDLDPALSPDGSRVAFSSTRDGGDERIYVMSIDGSGLRRVSDGPEGTFDVAPTWSPDGSRLAFTSDRDGVAQVYTMTADGRDVRRVTRNSYKSGQPAWSPDGSRIAFTSMRDGKSAIYVVGATGGAEMRISPAGVNDSEPNWSPDGQLIAFSSFVDGDWEIFVMRPDGSGRKQLTSNKVFDDYPSWLPDGTGIVFVSNRDKSWDLYAMSPDGSEVIRLTRLDTSCEWAPSCAGK